MAKKFKLTKVTKEVFGITLHQIIALQDGKYFKKGDTGGWLQKEENLSQEDDAWVFDNAKVFGNSKVYGSAMVCDNAKVFGDAKVYGAAKVFGNSTVYGSAMVCDNAKVFGDAVVCGNSTVFGDAKVKEQYDIVQVTNLGSRNSALTYCVKSDILTTGCFSGTLKEFEIAVKNKHKDTIHGKKYKKVIAYLKSLQKD